MLNNQTLYIQQHEYITAIFTEKCIDMFPDMSGYWGGVEIVQKHFSRVLPQSCRLGKIHYNRPNIEIAWIYRKRFGRVLRTTLKLDKNNNLFFIRSILGNQTKVGNEYFTLSFEKKRKYIEGDTLEKKLRHITDNDLLKKELEIFIGYVFEKFKETSSQNLDKRCYDVSLANTIQKNDGDFYFFDFEFIMNKGVPPSYLLYRIIRNPFIENKRQIYSFFCKKFNLQDTWDYWDFFHDLSEKEMLLPPIHNNKIYFKFFKIFLIRLISSIIPKHYRKRARHSLEQRFAKDNSELFYLYFN